ncbi:MAG: DUF502 domain-containing protein [Deltaproteobacteria bacterium]|nr:DUF502 domain-containing protein [Deltaproteobacteria bacterium]
MKKRIRRYFISGLLVVVPVALTIYILALVIKFTDRLYPLLKAYLPVYIPGFGIIVTFIIIILVGLITTNYLGKKLLGLGEKIIERIPIVKEIYQPIKQISVALFSLEHKNFRRVVLIEYPRKGIYTLVFVTGRAKQELCDKTGRKLLNVFVPTTPNPTSGFYLMVPEDDTISVDMDTEEAFRLIVSGGMATKH